MSTEGQKHPPESNETRQELVIPANPDTTVVARIQGVNVSARELMTYQQQQERVSHVTTTHTGAYNILKRWEAMPVTEPTTTPSPQALAHIVDTTGLVGTHLADLSETPMEDQRREQGLDQERRKLYAELAKKMTPREGLRMLERWTLLHLSKQCRTMKQLRTLFPEMTTLELMALPLLANVPDTLLHCSAGFTVGTDEDTSHLPTKATPMMLEWRPDGIAFGTECSHLESGTLSNESTNPKDREVVGFTRDVQRDMEKLIMLTIELPRLEELLKAAAVDAVPVGVGIIQRTALEQVRAQRPATAPGNTRLLPALPGQQRVVEVLQTALRDLDDLSKKAQAEAEAMLVSQLKRHTVLGADGVPMSLQQLTWMIGVLEKIPTVLQSTTPFQGQVRFYGSHMVFADSSGRVVATEPLSPVCYQHVRDAMLDESRASHANNRTMKEVRSELVARATTTLLGEYAQGQQTLADVEPLLSQIEYTSLAVLEETGVSLEALGEHRIEILKPLNDKPRTVAAPHISAFTIKMQSQEIQEYARILRLFGRKLLTGVEHVVKRQQKDKQVRKNIEMGQLCGVEVEPDSGTIAINEPYTIGYAIAAPDTQPERSFLLAFGCAKFVWATLSGTERQRWRMFHRASAQSGTLRQRLQAAASESDVLVTAAEAILDSRGPHLCNMLMTQGMPSEEDDFCTHMACYMLSPTEFRAAGAENRVILDKYRSIQNIIAAREGAERPEATDSMPIASYKNALCKQFPQIPSLDDFDAVMKFITEQSNLADYNKRTEELDSEDAERNDEETEEDEDDEEEDDEELNYEEEPDEEEITHEDTQKQGERYIPTKENIRDLMNELITEIDEDEPWTDRKKFFRDLWDILQGNDEEAMTDEIVELVEEYPELEEMISEDENATEAILSALYAAGFLTLRD